eukprot:5534508-Prymnesium_polylepis.1
MVAGARSDRCEHVFGCTRYDIERILKPIGQTMRIDAGGVHTAPPSGADSAVRNLLRNLFILSDTQEGTVSHQDRPAHIP